MIGFIIAVALAGSPHALALPGLNVVGIEKESAPLFAEVLAQALTARGLRVLTERDTTAVLGLERQRQLVGCTDSSACVAELAGALGIDGLLIADVGHLGRSYAINLKVLSARDGATLALFNTQVDSIEAVTGALKAGAQELLVQLTQTQHWQGLDASVHAAGGPSRWWAIAPAVVAIAGISLGVVERVQAQSAYTTLQTAPSLELAQRARDTGKTNETLSTVGFSVAGAAVVATAVLLLVGGGDSTPEGHVWVAPMLTPTAAGVGLGGSLPW